MFGPVSECVCVDGKRGGWEGGGHVSAVLGHLHLRMERFERFVNKKNGVHETIPS